MEMRSCCVLFFSSGRRHTRCLSDWSSDVCSSDLLALAHPWLKPFEVPICFAGLKPGASTEVEDISYTVTNNPGSAPRLPPRFETKPQDRTRQLRAFPLRRFQVFPRVFLVPERAIGKPHGGICLGSHPGG